MKKKLIDIGATRMRRTVRGHIDQNAPARGAPDASESRNYGSAGFLFIDHGAVLGMANANGYTTLGSA